MQDLVAQVSRGHVDVGQARSMINTMTMRQNSWTLGTYCESYCRVVTTHHTIEDVNMFPRLVAADPALAPVVERLEREHHDVAAVLEDVDRALVAMVDSSTGDGVEQVRRAVGTLSDVLLAHLAYEESQLVGPLNTLSLGFGWLRPSQVECRLRCEPASLETTRTRARTRPGFEALA